MSTRGFDEPGCLGDAVTIPDRFADVVDPATQYEVSERLVR
jgi:hypothetical protein